MSITSELNPHSSLDFKETLQDMYHTDTFRKKFGGVVTHQLVEATTEASEELRDKNRSERGHLTPEGLKYDVLAQLSDATDAEQLLNSDESYRLPSHQFKNLKETMSRFNESLKAWMESDPKLSLNDIVRYLSTYYRAQQAHALGEMSPHKMKDRLDWFRDDMTETLHGMRNEIGFEQMLGAMEINGYPIEYDTGSDKKGAHTDADLHGNDYFITMDGVRFGVDVKASEHTESLNRLKATHRGHNPHTIMWTQLEWEDFEGGLRLPQAVVNDKSKMDAIYRKLQEARYSFSKGQVEALAR